VDIFRQSAVQFRFAAPVCAGIVNSIRGLLGT
jgi:hypothetical protein